LQLATLELVPQVPSSAVMDRIRFSTRIVTYRFKVFDARSWKARCDSVYDRALYF